jgi:MFS family permease
MLGRTVLVVVPGPDVRPLRSGPFRWFFAGWSISMAGSAMAPVALAFGVLEVTGSAGWLSAVLTASTVPMIATMVVAGGIADRYRRDLVLWVASLGAGVSQVGVAFVLPLAAHRIQQ